MVSAECQHGYPGRIEIGRGSFFDWESRAVLLWLQQNVTNSGPNLSLITTLWEAHGRPVDNFRLISVTADDPHITLANAEAFEARLSRVRKSLPPPVRLYTIVEEAKTLLAPAITGWTLLPEQKDMVGHYPEGYRNFAAWMLAYKPNHRDQLVCRTTRQIQLLLDLLMFRDGEAVDRNDLSTHLGLDKYPDEQRFQRIVDIAYLANSRIKEYPGAAYHIQGIGETALYLARSDEALRP